jgi:hypothetical protein
MSGMAAWDLVGRRHLWQKKFKQFESPDGIADVVLSDDDSLLALTRNDGRVEIFDRHGKHVASVPARAQTGSGPVAIDPVARLLYFADQHLSVWSIDRGALVSRLSAQPNLLAIDPETGAIAGVTGGADSAQLIKADSGRSIGELRVEGSQRTALRDGFPQAIAFAPPRTLARPALRAAESRGRLEHKSRLVAAPGVRARRTEPRG